MFRAIGKLLSLTTVLTIGILGIVYYRTLSASDRQAAELLSENQQLHSIVDRLTDEHRVAKILVTDQKTIKGSTQTTLLFVEYAKNHTTLPPRQFIIKGNQLHLDAMVIKFQRDFIKQNDPLRGHSIALFTRIFGNQESPDSGSTIDPPDQVPGYYQGIDPKISQYELNLWQKFWELTKDESLRNSYGVRVSNGQGLWWNCQPGQLYTITIESDGGLNVSTEPVEPIYREALKHSGNQPGDQPAD